MSFKTDLVVKRDVSQDHKWILVEPLTYQNNEVSITINEGFDFDFASVPQTPIIAWLFPKSGTSSDRPSALHDALYSSEYFPRVICDAFFLESMHADNVSYVKRYAMYYAVRAFGWYVWMKHDKMEVQEYKKFVEVKYENDLS